MSNFPSGMTSSDWAHIADAPDGLYAIDQWVGTGEPWTGMGSWQPVDGTYDEPFDHRADAEAEVKRLVKADLARAWERFSGDSMDAEPDLSDFFYRVVDLDGRS